MSEHNDTKLCWTDQDLAETEQTGYERGYHDALNQMAIEVGRWQRPRALNFRTEVMRLIQLTMSYLENR